MQARIGDSETAAMVIDEGWGWFFQAIRRHCENFHVSAVGSCNEMLFDRKFKRASDEETLQLHCRVDCKQ